MGVILAGGVFAEISVSLDLAPLFKGFVAGEEGKNGAEDLEIFGIGAAVEFSFAEHYSAGAKLDLYTLKLGKMEGTYFGLAAQGRLYPISTNYDKFFIGTDIGFNTVKAEQDGTKIETSEITGLTFDLKAGYKHSFYNNFFLEPSLSYVIAKTSDLADFTPLGWQLGLNIGMSF
jgi:hypothetical protein